MAQVGNNTVAIQVGIQKVPNPNHLVFHLKEETRKHLKLGRRLFRIKGVLKDISSNYPICMNYAGHYSFGISKGDLFDWETEMLPAIKSEIEEYFLQQNKTVEFVEVDEMILD